MRNQEWAENKNECDANPAVTAKQSPHDQKNECRGEGEDKNDPGEVKQIAAAAHSRKKSEPCCEYREDAINREHRLVHYLRTCFA
jgi:hypothetical protein